MFADEPALIAEVKQWVEKAEGDWLAVTPARRVRRQARRWLPRPAL